MIFSYKAVDPNGTNTQGTIESVNIDIAISSLQRRGLTIAAISPVVNNTSILNKKINLFTRVKTKDVVILSRQMSTLFTAQVSALRVFRLLADETENPILANTLNTVADELQGGSSISNALSKHPKIFSPFYINMVRSGEEAGKLDEILLYLADYLDRTYEVTSKAKNALIYPSFVVFTFVVVMVLMLTLVIPNISKILEESGQEVPFYTQIVLGISDFVRNFGPYLIFPLGIGGFFAYRYGKTAPGKMFYSELRLKIPYIGTLYRKLYLSRIADNMNTMLISAIPIIKAIEITASVVGSAVYEKVLNESLEAVKGGLTLSEALTQHKEVPGIMIQMTKVGEETGELGDILKSLAKFYDREVINAVDTLVDLIEPAMIILLGVGVAILLASVLIPIYNISSGI